MRRATSAQIMEIHNHYVLEDEEREERREKELGRKAREAGGAYLTKKKKR
jgi:hypothetical protein